MRFLCFEWRLWGFGMARSSRFGGGDASRLAPGLSTHRVRRGRSQGGAQGEIELAQRGRNAGRILALTLGEIGLPAAAAAEAAAGDLGQLARVASGAGRQTLEGDDPGDAALLAPEQGERDLRRQGFRTVGEVADAGEVEAGCVEHGEGDARGVLEGGAETGEGLRHVAGGGRGGLLLRLLDLLLERSQAGRHLLGSDLETLGGLAQETALALDLLDRRGTGQ